MEIINDIQADQGKQQIKSNEITGDRYPIHSLPKEFQDWHNNYYIMEKQGDIDKNVVSTANLNGYMWLALGDGSKYGMAIFFITISAIIKIKLLGSFFLVLFLYMPILIYICYHFIFYAMIRAQIVGIVTKASANVTTFTFYTTFFGIYFSLMCVFVFILAISKDLSMFLFMTIKGINDNIDPSDSIMLFVENKLIFIHNILVEVSAINGVSLMDNTYFITLLFFLLSVLSVYIFESRSYKSRKLDIEKEIAKTKLEQGFPIETAQSLMTDWRKRNGM